MEVKIGKIYVNPYDVAELILFSQSDTSQAILKYRSGAEEVAFEGTEEQCKSLFRSPICQQIAKLIHDREVRRKSRTHEG